MYLKILPALNIGFLTMTSRYAAFVRKRLVPNWQSITAALVARVCVMSAHHADSLYLYEGGIIQFEYALSARKRKMKFNNVVMSGHLAKTHTFVRMGLFSMCYVLGDMKFNNVRIL